MVAEDLPKVACCSVQFPYMAPDCKTLPMKKFKITIKHLKDAAEDNSYGNTVKDVIENGQRNRFIGGGIKWKPDISLDGQGGKKQKLKMDRNLKLQLHKILDELINHEFGWIFSEPVDPVELGIPDYFSIISKPMDLGTILHKLEENMYNGSDEFAADVRLTFANAMLYNPPGSEVHYWAEKLDVAFRRKWKLPEVKLKHGKKNDEEARLIDQIGDKYRQNVKPIGLNRARLPVKLGTSNLMSFEEKQKFRLELLQLISRKMVKNLQTVLQKFGLSGLNKERLSSYIDSTDDGTLLKLRREVNVLLGAKDGKVKAGKVAINGCSTLDRTVEKEHPRRSALASAVSTNQRKSIDSTCFRNGAAQGYSSDVSSERSTEHNLCGDCKLECGSKYPLESRTSSSSLDSDGPGVIVNEANSPHLSTPAGIEGWTFNVRMSPKKALRVAMLKKRFADTIFRATHQELLGHSDKLNTLKMQQERERLERQHQEEKTRIEAQIKAAEALWRREQEDLKMRHERERKAARMISEKIEKSVEINDNVGVFKDLDTMGCRYLYYPVDGNRMWFDGIHHGNPLEQLGLYLKDEGDLLEEEDEDATLNREEGEILS